MAGEGVEGLDFVGEKVLDGLVLFQEAHALEDLRVNDDLEFSSITTTCLFVCCEADITTIIVSIITISKKDEENKKKRKKKKNRPEWSKTSR